MKIAKNFLLVFFLVFIVQSIVHGQETIIQKEVFSARHWQASIKDGVGKGSELSKYVNSQEVYRHNILQIQAGYYPVDKLMVGIGFTWSTEWSIRRPEQEAFTDFMKGPLVRYQFTHSRISPFLEASYQFGKRRTGPRSLLDYVGNSVRSTLINAGINVGVTSQLRLDLSYGVQFKTFIDQSIVHQYPQVGVNYVFGGRKTL